MKEVSVRQETKQDVDAVRRIIAAAFENHPHSNQTEHFLVDKLRECGALSISLAAEIEGMLVGHIAFSPITIDGKPCHWYGLGPVSVAPDFQRQGIGSVLIRAGPAALKAQRAAGCVVLGEPEYYTRFGFRPGPDLILEGVPAEYFMSLSFVGERVQGIVSYHPAFSECG